MMNLGNATRISRAKIPKNHIHNIVKKDQVHIELCAKDIAALADSRNYTVDDKTLGFTSWVQTLSHVGKSALKTYEGTLVRFDNFVRMIRNTEGHMFLQPNARRHIPSIDPDLMIMYSRYNSQLASEFLRDQLGNIVMHGSIGREHIPVTCLGVWSSDNNIDQLQAAIAAVYHARDITAKYEEACSDCITDIANEEKYKLQRSERKCAEHKYGEPKLKRRGTTHTSTQWTDYADQAQLDMKKTHITQAVTCFMPDEIRKLRLTLVNSTLVDKPGDGTANPMVDVYADDDDDEEEKLLEAERVKQAGQADRVKHLAANKHEAELASLRAHEAEHGAGFSTDARAAMFGSGATETEAARTEPELHSVKKKKKAKRKKKGKKGKKRLREDNGEASFLFMIYTMIILMSKLFMRGDDVLALTWESFTLHENMTVVKNNEVKSLVMAWMGKSERGSAESVSMRVWRDNEVPIFDALSHMFTFWGKMDLGPGRQDYERPMWPCRAYHDNPCEENARNITHDEFLREFAKYAIQVTGRSGPWGVHSAKKTAYMLARWYGGSWGDCMQAGRHTDKATSDKYAADWAIILDLIRELEREDDIVNRVQPIWRFPLVKTGGMQIMAINNTRTSVNGNHNRSTNVLIAEFLARLTTRALGEPLTWAKAGELLATVTEETTSNASKEDEMFADLKSRTTPEYAVFFREYFHEQLDRQRRIAVSEALIGLGIGETGNKRYKHKGRRKNKRKKSLSDGASGSEGEGEELGGETAEDTEETEPSIRKKKKKKKKRTAIVWGTFDMPERAKLNSNKMHDVELTVLEKLELIKTAAANTMTDGAIMSKFKQFRNKSAKPIAVCLKKCFNGDEEQFIRAWEKNKCVYTNYGVTCCNVKDKTCKLLGSV